MFSTGMHTHDIFKNIHPFRSISITPPLLSIRVPWLPAGSNIDDLRRAKPHVRYLMPYPYRPLSPRGIPRHLRAEHGEDGANVVPP